MGGFVKCEVGVHEREGAMWIMAAWVAFFYGGEIRNISLLYSI